MESEEVCIYELVHQLLMVVKPYPYLYLPFSFLKMLTNFRTEEGVRSDIPKSKTLSVLSVILLSLSLQKEAN